MAKQPHLLVEPGDLYDIVLLPGDPDRVDRILNECDDATVIAHNREFKVGNATYQGTNVSVCSTGIGSPSAAIAVEELNRVGVTTVIRPGTTGALQKEIAIGDMVIATGAAKDEGTTRRYEPVTYPAVADLTVVTALVEAARREGDKPHIGPIVTDDAFYAETTEYVKDWEAAGLLAVEMEAAAIFTLARRNGLRAGAICTVDGNLVEGTQKGETDSEELPEKARTNIDRMVRIALNAAVSLS